MAFGRREFLDRSKKKGFLSYYFALSALSALVDFLTV
jgi:hypothetical protein